KRPLRLAGFVAPEPVIEAAVVPRTARDGERFGAALAQIVRDDPSLRIVTDGESGETRLAGMGELHLQIVVEALMEAHGIDVALGAPAVAYREAITRPVTVDWTHRKQNGGVGQFARVVLAFAPREDEAAGLDFRDATTGGAVPKPFAAAVEAALADAMVAGPLAGVPVHGLAATLLDGAHHTQDSSALAFDLAARAALADGLAKAAPVLLEPLMAVTVTVPDDHVGAVVGDLQARRGRVEDIASVAGARDIRAAVPLSELFQYVGTLRSLTRGRGTFAMRHAGHARVPAVALNEALRRAG
ncbi:MAG: elongation factor G, partial [Pseudomonadota bacterium]